MNDLLEWLVHGTIPVPGGELGAREVIGNLFGLASAMLGMKRLVWAWPVGLVGNVLLFTVFVSGELSGAVAEPLWGQAGRQILFVAVGLRLVALVAGGPGGAPPTAARSRPGGRRTPSACSCSSSASSATRLRTSCCCRSAPTGPPTEAWILAGSMLATYGMARGWVEFWLVWILVDVVGVTTLVQAGYYPTAGMYLFYAVFVVIGFVVWRRDSQTVVDATEADEPERVRHDRHHEPVRLDPVERAVADIAAGRAVVVVDDEDRENEGDIIFAAAKATPELMAFTIRHSSGVICVPMPATCSSGSRSR